VVFLRYDLHTHTTYSKCGRIRPEQLLRVATKRGLDGIAVTDHNTIQGALATAKLNKNKDFEVIVGSETSTKQGHVLGYYLNKKIASDDIFEVINQIKEQGGISAVAHPYTYLRESLAIPFEKIRPDAFECFNGRSIFPFENSKAKKAALKSGLPVIAGSDAHFPFEVGRVFTEFKGNLKKALRNKSTAVHGTTFYGFLGVSFHVIGL